MRWKKKPYTILQAIEQLATATPSWVRKLVGSERTYRIRVGDVEPWLDHQLSLFRLFKSAIIEISTIGNRGSAMPTIGDIFDIPTQVHQGDFVLRLAEGVTRPADTLGTYVVTPQLVLCFRSGPGLDQERPGGQLQQRRLPAWQLWQRQELLWRC